MSLEGRLPELSPASIARDCNLPIRRRRQKAMSFDEVLQLAVDAYWERRPYPIARSVA